MTPTDDLSNPLETSGDDTPPVFKASDAKPGTVGSHKVDDLYDKIESESTILGKIASKIPGFDGYIESSRRREADQMLRYHIARHLDGNRMRLANVHEHLASDIVQAMEYAEPLGRADAALQGLSAKIKDAPVGYSGFFSAIKIGPEELARLYKFDEQMLLHADEIETAVLALEKATLDKGDIGSAIRELQTQCNEAITAFDGRHNVLTGVE